MVQWTAEAARIREATDVAKMALGLIFASAFQVPILAQSTLYRICLYPEYFERLKIEAEESQDLSFDNNNREMPYMDSFMKEAARLGAGPILSVPRKVMSHYTAPDGLVVPTGNWIAVPQLPWMRDPKIWPGGDTFNGFRFVHGDGCSATRFTHPSLEFPFWGSIRHACPARFYVSVIVKIVLAHLLVEYEFKLENSHATPFFSFGITRLPNPFMIMLVRKRSSTQKNEGETHY
ncbi:MAG: hypothetical protein Q9191_008269 [Dirinaria sp. TL-2023a]